jgi:hypothetical protein
VTFHAQEFAEAIRDAIAAATLSFAPSIVMVGDLAHYPENESLSADLPAVFVEAAGWEAEPWDNGATALAWVSDYRVVVVDSWSESDDLHALRTARVKAIWDLFASSATSDLDLAGSTVAGPMGWTALPFRAQLADLPEEIELISRGAKKLFAVALWIRIRGETSR